MAINFKKVAQEEISISPLCAGREKLKTEELLGKELTITHFDFASISDDGDTKTYPIILFDEYPNHYYAGGTIFTKMCMAWVVEYDGDVERASQDLYESGGVRIKMSATRTRNGNNLTSVEII